MCEEKHCARLTSEVILRVRAAPLRVLDTLLVAGVSSHRQLLGD